MLRRIEGPAGRQTGANPRRACGEADPLPWSEAGATPEPGACARGKRWSSQLRLTRALMETRSGAPALGSVKLNVDPRPRARS